LGIQDVIANSVGYKFFYVLRRKIFIVVQIQSFENRQQSLISYYMKIFGLGKVELQGISQNGSVFIEIWLCSVVGEWKDSQRGAAFGRGNQLKGSPGFPEEKGNDDHNKDCGDGEEKLTRAEGDRHFPGSAGFFSGNLGPGGREQVQFLLVWGISIYVSKCFMKPGVHFILVRKNTRPR
jgi:hypothetical protein